MAACSLNLVAGNNHLERIQRFAPRLVTGIRHLPLEEKLQQLGLDSLQQGRLRVDLNTACKIVSGLLEIDVKFFFLRSTQRGLREKPHKVLQGASHRRRNVPAFSVRVVKY